MSSRSHSGQDEDVEDENIAFHGRKHVRRHERKDRASVKTSGDLPQEGSEKKRRPKLHRTSSDGERYSSPSDSEASHKIAYYSDGDLAAERKVRHSSKHRHRRSHLSATDATSGKSAGSSYHESSDEKKHNPGTEISRLSKERQRRRQGRRERKREVFLSDLDKCIKASEKRGWQPSELKTWNRFRRRVERLDIRQSDYEDLLMERREEFLLKYKEALQKGKKKLDRLDDDALRRSLETKWDSDNRLGYVESELAKVNREKELAAFVQRVKDHTFDRTLYYHDY
ncbi:uncharacterized protein FOMMEDRAFT_152743 [Fomitiporia mediterranea MF3/22]|uniref:uncharacterized protein n=1 Tax=Fomitiporia mediterranea (strain MF3/22) TaxID=694068 RepID=UPI0004408214|nr:uncharacterized protein FOMMEDRAFT_152743 [Fomitiporia mediterranea MF3/22]EJD05433.1 hypothetical protein FOMMEDRAFT_152743 [Fomitiporia mediterranea MF3/22]